MNSEYNDLFNFQRLCSDFQGYMACKDESPDFTFFKDGQIIGLEHTKISPNKKEQELRGIENQIKEKVKSTVLKKIAIPIDVDVHLRHKYYYKQVRSKEIVKRLTEIILSLDIEDLGVFKHRDFDLLSYPNWLQKIYITRMPSWDYCSWDWSRAGWCINNPIKYIQESLDKKESLLPRYLEKCDKISLLLVTGHGSENYMHLKKEALNHSFFSSANKVYLLELPNKCFTLKVLKR